MNSHRHAMLVCPAAFAAMCCLGCAGYQVGNGTLYSPDISTVYVPVVESYSFRPGIGEALTEAIAKRIEERTPYKVVGTPNADSILSAKLIEDSKRVIVENLYDEPRSTDVNYQVQVQWINRKGDLIYGGAVPLPPAMVEIGQSAPYIPEYGQTYVTAEYDAVQKLADEIVGLMERPW